MKLTNLCVATGLLLASAAPLLAQSVEMTTAQGPVSVGANPENVVVFDFGVIDTMDALGVAPVGVPSPIYLDYLSDLESVTSVGTLFEPDFEQVFSLKPELIIVASRSATQREALEKIAPTIDLTLPGDDLVQEAIAQTHQLGALFGKDTEAEDLTANFEDSLAALRNETEGKGSALIVMTNGPKLSAYGPGSRFGWIHNGLGLEPADPEVDVKTHGEAISYEFIHEMNPDWLLVIDRAAAVGQDGESAQSTLDNELIHQTTAWQEDQVVYLNGANVYIAPGGIQSMQATVDQLTEAFAE
ncbi:siderophore ABC transporter substrate-binding protein [Qingshengfaniella alkalisoli]|uniref:Siderophore ABC transporter substrate-binding protein n=1 Tax=Qingshengfaniella alkalisoli TaxID=2599296 RepID=A0A5B8J4Q4_9RHOB|nr:siderophore ABC transporter substrate-binding protein [Qingshengfaniella alkalisoli]QDY71678.1 siderophore ABC transporter substrate-binding protein [Qingshengfaniella alkalisoli]